MWNKLGKIGTAAALVWALNAGTWVDAKANDVDLTTDQTKFAASKAIQDDSVKDLSQLDRYVKFNGTDGGYGTGDTIWLSTLDWLTWIEYSDLYWPIVNVWLQINKEDWTQSFLLQWSYSKWWSDKKSEKRLLAWYWYKVSDNSVITFLWERLIQEKDYLSELWGDPKAYNYDATQDKLGLNFRLHSFDFKWYYSKSYDKKLENREIIIDSTDFWQQYWVTTKFKWQEAYGANIWSKFDLTDNIDLETAIWTSVVDWESFVDGWAKVNVHMWHKWYVYLDVHTTGDINTGSVWYEWNVFDTWATWTASASYTEWPNDHEETRWSLMLNIPLWKRSKKNYKKPSYDSLDNVSNTVRYDVRDFKSSVVRWEVVEEQKLISEVDKNALPAGSTVDSETWNITVPWLSANATSFESITRDGNTISDNGAFAISWGNLTINLDKLEEPEWEDDIYKLLTNWNPQNEITVHVIKGSKKVVSVSVKTLDTISTIWAPTLESKTDTTINAKAWTFDDADWVEWVTVVLYSDAELTKFVASRVDGDFTWLDQNTTYYVVTEWKAKNASTW